MTLVTSALVLAMLGAPGSVRAAGSTFWVDAKAGSDANDGRSPATAFRTIAHAADAIPRGSAAAGYHVIVKGYADTIYRERPISPGWDRAGTASAPIVFEAAGYAAGGSNYVRPIVSGADAAPQPGKSWQAAGRQGVWKTAWSTAPFDYGKGLATVVFQDATGWLRERSDLTTLGSAAASGAGGFVYQSGWLYVAPTGAAATEPASHTFDVVQRNAFFFKGNKGTQHVEVRGFEVRHSANGIAFKSGVDNSLAADNVLVGNLYMGIQVSGDDTGGRANPARHVVVRRNVFIANTLQGIKIDRGTQASEFCDNDISGSGLAGIKLQGAPPGVANVLVTKGNRVCRNNLHDNTYNPTGSAWANTSGLTIANGARSNTVDRNRIHDNLVGIHVTQEGTGRLTLDGNRLKKNRIWSNARYGIYFYDGMYRSGGGAITSLRDLIWDNGVGVRVDRGSSGKRLKRDTIFRSRSDGVRVGLGKSTPASARIVRSIVTHNGGYGISVPSSGKAYLSFVAVSRNADGSWRGLVVRSGVNKRSPRYLSKSPVNADFLRISRDSYQYRAGPRRTPIGARW